MLLVYDGECGFCMRTARWFETRLPAEARVEPWQSLELGEFGLSEHDAGSAVWWIEERATGQHSSGGAEAIGRALVAAGGPWRLVGHLMARPPVLWLARPAYTVVAANRRRLPGTRRSRP